MTVGMKHDMRPRPFASRQESITVSTLPATPQFLTAEQYAVLPDDGRRTELVRGRVVVLNMPMPVHGYICARIARLLGNHVDEHDLGRVLSNDSGVITARNPDSVRGADVAFYSYNRLPRGPLPDEYPPLPPELVFEVRSPGDSGTRVIGKAAEYIEAGVLQVCVVDPYSQLITSYGVNMDVQLLRNDDSLTFPEILPLLSIRVRQLLT